jgi:outer membrane protein
MSGKEIGMRHILFGFVSMLALTTMTSAETLTEALASAYTNNPELAAQRAGLRAQDEEISIARSGYRPQASITGSAQQSVVDASGQTADGTFNQNYGAQISQPLYRGGRTKNSVSAAERSIFASREQLRSVEQNIMLAAVSAFSDVIRDQAVVSLNQNQVDVLRQQLRATKDRFRVGELTRTDVAQSEARVARADSNRVGADGALTRSREAYRRVVGTEPGTLVKSGLPALPPTLEDAIATALKESPNLNAAKLSEEAARFNVATAKGAIYPSADAVAGVSRTIVTGSNNIFNGRSSTNANVGARVTIPLYQSGAEYARARQAQQLQSQRQIQIAVTERQVIEQVSNAWAQLRTAQGSIEATKAAVKANEIALEGVRQEQTVGSRTILDVLDAEQELLSSRVSLVQAERDEIVAAHGVRAAVGQLDAKALALPVDVYDPAKHYENVKDKWFGWDETK